MVLMTADSTSHIRHKRLLYLAFVRLPTEKAHGLQIMKTCEALAASGLDVELVVPGRKTHLTDDPFSYYGVEKNFTLTTLNTPDFVQLGPFGFLASVVWFSEVAKMHSNFWDVDIVYSRDASVLLQYLLLGRKYVYEAHTTPTWVSRVVARFAHRLVVISKGLGVAYREAGVREEKIVIAHDAVDPHMFETAFDQKTVRQKFGIPDTTVFLYVGKIDEEKGVTTFAKASECGKEGLAFVAVGAGPRRVLLKEKYTKVLFLNETPYRDLPGLLAAGDVLVIPNSARHADTALYTSPLKAFAYLASGKPIVASDVPALREVFAGQEGVTFFEPDNPEALCAALQGVRAGVPFLSRKIFSWRDRAAILTKALE